MNSPTNSSIDQVIDDLVAHATVKDYGDMSIITIPGIEALSESEQFAAAKKAEQRLLDPLDAATLRSRLESVTPPLDQEEEDEESRVMEAQARKDLESDGCPACYPLHLEVPVRNPPEEHRQIIGYWQSLTGTGDVVLCAQRSDWRDFRAYQLWDRSRYRKEKFSVYVDRIRERRRRHGLGNGVHLLVDLQQQGQQENWIEFQDYHLKRHEQLERKRDEIASDAANIVPGDPARNEAVVQANLEYAERRFQSHKILLGWIEQQRLTMDQRPSTSFE